MKKVSKKKQKSGLEKGIERALKEAVRRKKIANKYRKAANVVDRFGYACHAISKVVNKNPFTYSPYHDLFHKMFKPKTKNAAYFSFTEVGDFEPKYSSGKKLGKLSRAIALDLLAELVETGSVRIS